ncbi:hypothetical protein O3M35_008067 [Rhynocoris fuscipes]|uniref:Uncharacterized protein n=1 Tax=Rhynocoris fuscipes TaxID=488301 RepID=A0AAW1DC16_9HEMI
MSRRRERGSNKHFSQQLNITFFLQPFTNNIVFSKRRIYLYLLCHYFPFDCWGNS